MMRKLSVLTIERDDGSYCYTKLKRGLEFHDLAHFAIESVLGFKNAFYGIINQGFRVEDFEAPIEKRPEAVQPKNLHPEAMITEQMVNLLQVELFDDLEKDQFIPQLKTILQNDGLEFPDALNKEKLDDIRKTLEDCCKRWNNLTEGDSLVLNLEFK